MMPRSLLGSFTALLAAAASLGGQPAADVARDAFRYERSISPGARGLNRLPIDLPLLAGGRPFRVVGDSAGGGLTDLRLFDMSGREVPYLLVAPAPPGPAWVSGQVLAVAATKKTSGFEVDLGRASLVDRMRMAGLPAPMLKRLQLEGSGDRLRWALLVSEGTVFDLPDERLRQLELAFAAGEYRYLRVTWDDTASARVPLPASVDARQATAGAPAAALRASLAFDPRPSEPGRSRYRIQLPAAHLPIAAIELMVRSGDVLRDARVTEARLQGGEVAPAVLGAATLRRTVRGSLAAAELRIPVSSPAEAQIELAIDDGSNPPLDLTGVVAVFATLPSIYFDAPDRGPLIARYGRPDLAAPRYDLEAARDSLAAQPSTAATWGPVVHTAAAIAEPPVSPVAFTGAQLDIAAFRFTRTVPGVRLGLNALALDAAVLAHAALPGLADVRIATASGHQIPYVIEKLDEPLSVGLRPLEKGTPPRSPDTIGGRTPGTRSYYRLLLPYDTLPSSRLALETDARVFDRVVFVMTEREGREPRRPGRPQWVAGRGWRHADPDTAAPALVLDLQASRTRDLLVIVEEGDNQPLPLLPPRLLLPAFRLRFFHESDAPCLLLYGRTDLAAPRYDLVLLAPRLLGAAAHEVTPGPESATPPPSASALPPAVFWSALIAAVVVLLLLVVRLLGQKA